MSELSSSGGRSGVRMGGDLLKTSSSMESIHSMYTGTESELLRIEGAQLFLLDAEESVRMGVGDFALILMVQANSPLATLVSQVGEFQWPLGKDGPVLKIANYRYTFSIPGLLYGLILPDTTSRDQVVQFETYMRKYCTFEVRPEISQAAGVTDLRLSPAGASADGVADGASYWTAVAEDVENYSTRLARQISSGSNAAASTIMKGGDWANWGIRQGGFLVKKNLNSNKASEGEISPRMRKRVEQARRMSAVAKVLSKTVLKGALSASGHVANFLGTAIRGTPPMRAFLISDSRREVAVASIDAFAKVVEAVETAGRSIAGTTSTVSADIVQHRFGEEVGLVAKDGMDAMGNVIDSVWTLNKVGLRMLWQATAATALGANRHGSASSRSHSGGSTSTDTLSAISPQSAQQIDSAGSFPTESLAGHLSLGPTVSGSPPRSPHEDVPHTAQFFPRPSTGVHSRSQMYPIVPHPYVSQHIMPMPMPPGFTAFYSPDPNPNSPFQFYPRPPGPPPRPVQAFFPYCHSFDVPKSQ